MKDGAEFDLSTTVGAVTRKLDKVERDGQPAWRLLASRLYATDVEDAWDALTNPARIPRWFLPVSGTLEIGGLTTPQGIEIIRGCYGLDIVGCDLVEVAPIYDVSGMTSRIAGDLLYEMLCVLPGVERRGA